MRPKSKPEDQYGFITKHERRPNGALEFTTTKKNRVQMDCNGKHSFLDDEEVFGLIGALIRTGARQWGQQWLERVQRYTISIVMLGGEQGGE